MRLPLLSLLAILAAAPAAAEEAAPAGRYAFVPADVGAFRLDTETGEVSLCSGEAGALTCLRVMGGPDPAASADLVERIARLEARLTALEAERNAGATLPDEEAMDRVMVLTERMFRQFFAMVRNMKREMEGESL